MRRCPSWTRAIGLSLLLLTLQCTRASELPAAAPGPAPDARLHALLLNGGGEPRINYYSHLHHLRRALERLEAAGVEAERIAVFSSDGSDPEPDLATVQESPHPDAWLLPSEVGRYLRPPIRYVDSAIDGVQLRPATRESLRAWFENEGQRLAAGDTLLFYVTDHGERNPEDLSNNTISLWHEKLSVREFEELHALLDPGVRVVMLMSQCFSGSFAHAILAAGGEPQGNLCGYFAATADRRASGCYPQVSRSEEVGYSHRIFDALAREDRLGDAELRVLTSDRTPDTPHRTSHFYLEQRLEAAAAAEGREAAALIDELLAEARRDPRSWEREIRLLDRLGQVFGFASPRSLADLEAQVEDLSLLSERLETYAKRWEAALEDLRREQLRDFRERHPKWRERLRPTVLRALDDDDRRVVEDHLLETLRQDLAEHPERAARLESLNWKASEADDASYRAEVRLGAALRMRAILVEVAGRRYMAGRAPAAEREALEGLAACEDLRVGGSSELAEAEGGEPLPTLEEERQRLEAIAPAWLGIRYAAVKAEDSGEGPLPRGAARVRAVYPDSPAERAGLRVSDVLLGPPGTPFQEPGAVREWTMQGEVGAARQLALLRDGQTMQVTLHLAPYPLELPSLGEPPKIGSRAPELELKLVRGEPPAPEQEQLLFFWATWCGPCKRALPEVLALQSARDLALVAITDEAPEVIESYARDFEGALPARIASDVDRVNFQRYGVSGTPTLVLLDEADVVLHHQVGYDPDQGITLEDWSWDPLPAP